MDNHHRIVIDPHTAAKLPFMDGPLKGAFIPATPPTPEFKPNRRQRRLLAREQR